MAAGGASVSNANKRRSSRERPVIAYTDGVERGHDYTRGEGGVYKERPAAGCGAKEKAENDSEQHQNASRFRAASPSYSKKREYPQMRET